MRDNPTSAIKTVKHSISNKLAICFVHAIVLIVLPHLWFGGAPPRLYYNYVIVNTPQAELYGVYMACSMKRDHLEIFINIEFLTSVDSPFYVEYDGESFETKVNIDYNDNVYVLGFILLISGKHPFEEFTFRWEVHDVMNYINAEYQYDFILLCLLLEIELLSLFI